jgi:dCMP deaminase
MARISKNQMYMDVATAVARRSHDEETQVGAVLVKNKTGAIVATGFNGFVRGAPDDKLPKTRPDKYPFMMHAEQNIIANCAKHGISMDDCMLVCTHSPCEACMRIIYQCGITDVIVQTMYRDFDKVTKMQDLGVSVEQLEGGLVRLRYEPK